jgi:hypothetical protein
MKLDTPLCGEYKITGKRNGSRMFLAITVFIRKKMEFVSVQNVTENDLVGVKRLIFWFLGFATVILGKNKS